METPFIRRNGDTIIGFWSPLVWCLPPASLPSSAVNLWFSSTHTEVSLLHLAARKSSFCLPVVMPTPLFHFNPSTTFSVTGKAAWYLLALFILEGFYFKFFCFLLPVQEELIIFLWHTEIVTAKETMRNENTLGEEQRGEMKKIENGREVVLGWGWDLGLRRPCHLWAPFSQLLKSWPGRSG